MRAFILSLCCWCAFPVSAEASRLVGKADFDVLWFTVYNAELYHPNGAFKFDNVEGSRLELQYQVDITSEELVEATIDEWRKLGFVQTAQHKSWREQLLSIWPDISEGDRLVVEINAQGRADFSHQSHGKALSHIGSINSKQFSIEFLSIWLADRDQHTEFRAQLLGQKE
ncbi:chalcone isomerase family protein [Echinimonas agarilytica]|uniref:Chalcone isomerase family protein n=1 Tax=Echinimonas agarilytica TaxID=1215918 RepID=A0AA42B7R4_9GAMM|nr:chalcone isomerase family protein [Echinimonas agarilytica]MCM2680004.1 chalcone isomerase family protein [Echinimonas agarilytica]